jgi:hypothetical protein
MGAKCRRTSITTPEDRRYRGRELQAAKRVDQEENECKLAKSKKKVTRPVVGPNNAKWERASANMHEQRPEKCWWV